MPSPVPDNPGLLLRDPFRYTEDVLVVPPPWAALLQLLDGEHDVLDAQAVMTRLAGGEVVPRETVEQFLSVLSGAGYLDDDALEARKRERHEAFENAPAREAILAGSAYPETPEAIEKELTERCRREPGTSSGESAPWPLAIAAPHVSPEGGLRSYCAAYDLPPAEDDMTFVILGTSHYGAPERFGVTAKPFTTPLGTAPVDTDALSVLVERGGDAVIEEDYCHRAEHSIEFQVLFLQHRLDRPFRIVPILCGPFASSLTAGRPPESVGGNARVFDALAELASRRPGLVWVLGVDLAHIGVRYGDPEPVRANEGRMLSVRDEDRRRLRHVQHGDPEGFFDCVHPGGDPLNWCGYAPIYTFLRSVGSVSRTRGELLSYEQWNIDPGSVVSFAAMHFRPESK